MPNYRRYYLTGHPVFVTLVTHGRRPWLGENGNAEKMLAAMRRVKHKHPFRQVAHVVLPDHVHWLFAPSDPNFSRIVAAVKREVTWRLNDGGKGLPPYWQKRFYDHVIRDEADFARHLDYIHYNPVKHGLTAMPAAYPSSSFRAWVERGVYELDWGSSEPERIAALDLE